MFPLRGWGASLGQSFLQVPAPVSPDLNLVLGVSRGKPSSSPPQGSDFSQSPARRFLVGLMARIGHTKLSSVSCGVICGHQDKGQPAFAMFCPQPGMFVPGGAPAPGCFAWWMFLCCFLPHQLTFTPGWGGSCAARWKIAGGK